MSVGKDLEKMKLVWPDLFTCQAMCVEQFILSQTHHHWFPDVAPDVE